MKTKIDIAVLIPCYNDLDGLKQSLDSLTKAEGRFLVLVVDDYSFPAIEVNLVGHTYNFPLVFIRSDSNGGIERALNKGLDYLLRDDDIKYLARLDCGDTVIEDRLSSQKLYLDSHQDTALVGGYANIIGVSGEFMYVQKYPREHSEITKLLKYQNQFCHPSVMFRFEIFRSGVRYPLNYPCAEDYALFCELSANYKLSNLGRVLVNYVVSPASLSSKGRRLQTFSRLHIQIRYFNVLSVHSYLGVVRTICFLLIPRSASVLFKKYIYMLQSS